MRAWNCIMLDIRENERYLSSMSCPFVCCSQRPSEVTTTWRIDMHWLLADLFHFMWLFYLHGQSKKKAWLIEVIMKSNASNVTVIFCPDYSSLNFARRPDSHTGRSLVKFPSSISTNHKLSSVTVLQTKSVRFAKYRTYTNVRRCSSIRKCTTYMSRFHI